MSECVNVASSAMVVGAVMECIVILIGYVIRFLLRRFAKGG